MPAPAGQHSDGFASPMMHACIPAQSLPTALAHSNPHAPRKPLAMHEPRSLHTAVSLFGLPSPTACDAKGCPDVNLCTHGGSSLNTPSSVNLPHGRHKLSTCFGRRPHPPYSPFTIHSQCAAEQTGQRTIQGPQRLASGPPCVRRLGRGQHAVRRCPLHDAVQSRGVGSVRPCQCCSY